ncbi:MAG: hypothetical protein RSC76_02485, partial [Oscillospiraceae bacterium]
IGKNVFQTGDLRGKISDTGFYFYQSDNAPRSFTTILRGTLEENRITYQFVRHNYTKALMLTALVLWVIISFVILYTRGIIGLLAFAVIPFMLLPYLIKSKAELKKLTEILAGLCKPETQIKRKQVS